MKGQCSSPSLYCVCPSLAQLAAWFQSSDVVLYHMMVFLHSGALWWLKQNYMWGIAKEAVPLDDFGRANVVRVQIACVQESVKNPQMDFSHYNQNDNKCYVVRFWVLQSHRKKSLSILVSWLGFSARVESMLWLVQWKDNGVDLAVVIHKVDLQALGDVVWQVREVLPVFSWQDNAGHTSTPGLTRTRKSSSNSGVNRHTNLKLKISNWLLQKQAFFALTQRLRIVMSVVDSFNMLAQLLAKLSVNLL